MTDWTHYTHDWNPNRQCLPSRLREIITRACAWDWLATLFVCIYYTENQSLFLPPAKGVWGKVISLEASVCPQGGSTWPGTPRDQLHPPSRQPPPGPGTPPEQTPPPHGQRAGGPHPTGMQSCFFNSVDDCDFKIAKLVVDRYYIVVLLVILRESRETLADPGGSPGVHPLDQNFLNFMQFFFVCFVFGKFSKIFHVQILTIQH